MRRIGYLVTCMLIPFIGLQAWWFWGDSEEEAQKTEEYTQFVDQWEEYSQKYVNASNGMLKFRDYPGMIYAVSKFFNRENPLSYNEKVTSIEQYISKLLDKNCKNDRSICEEVLNVFAPSLLKDFTPSKLPSLKLPQKLTDQNLDKISSQFVELYPDPTWDELNKVLYDIARVAAGYSLNPKQTIQLTRQMVRRYLAGINSYPSGYNKVDFKGFSNKLIGYLVTAALNSQ